MKGMGIRVHTLREMRIFMEQHPDLFGSIDQTDFDSLQMMLNESDEELMAQVKEIEAEMEDIKQRTIADGTFMKAPNGKKSNLSERQWLQVRTKAFKNWFGDWENDPKNASKIIDENGEPMVMAHASSAEFSVFRLGRPETTSGRGMYFGRAPKDINTYSYSGNGRSVYLCFLNIRNLYNNIHIHEKNDAGKIIPNDIMNEIIGASSYEMFLEDLKNYPKKFGHYQDITKNISKNTYQKIHDKYDGKGLFASDKHVVKHIFKKNETYLTLNPSFIGEIVTRDPNQIKSATDNIGTFSNERNEIQLLKTPSGEVYGFVYQGEIYIDETKLDPQAPVHEYTHIWDEAVMQTNPALWERGKRLLRDSNNDVLRNLWNEIAQSDAYGKKWQAQGKTQEEIDNLIASEVHSRLTGEKGGELLQQIEQAQGGKGIIGKLKRWLEDMFKHIGKTFGTWTEDALNELTLDDFINMPLRDFLDGVNPTATQQDIVGEM